MSNSANAAAFGLRSGDTYQQIVDRMHRLQARKLRKHELGLDALAESPNSLGHPVEFHELSLLLLHNPIDVIVDSRGS